MSISEEKMRIVIDNYFKSECDVNTSIRQAFEKGFRIGVKKGESAQIKTGEWILECDSEGEGDNLYRCSECGSRYGCQEYDKPNFCLECGAKMSKGGGNE